MNFDEPWEPHPRPAWVLDSSTSGLLVESSSVVRVESESEAREMLSSLVGLSEPELSRQAAALAQGEVLLIRPTRQRSLDRVAPLPLLQPDGPEVEGPIVSLAPEEEPDVDWVGLELVDEDGDPVVGEKFRLVKPDGSMVEGRTDHLGRTRIPLKESAPCRFTFGELDGELWEAG